MNRNRAALGCVVLAGLASGPFATAQQPYSTPNASGNYTSSGVNDPSSTAYRNARGEGAAAAGIPSSYNLKLGEVYIRTGAGMNFSYNDNISLRTEDEDPDFIISSNARVGVYVPLTRENAFRFSLDMGGVFYLNHDEYNHFSLYPNGDNSFELYAQTDNWSFRLRDSFSLYMSPMVMNRSVGSTDMMQFQNITTFTGDADYDKLLTGFAYTHGFYKYWGNDYEYLDRQNDALHAYAGVRVSSPVIVGADVGIDRNYYDAGDLNGSLGFNTSIYSQFVLSRAISGRASVGWGWTDYEGGGRFDDNENYNDIIFSLGLSHEVNKYFRHSINLYKNVEPGVTSNFQDTIGLSYNAGWDLFRFWTVDVLYGYTYYDSSDSEISESASMHRIRLGNSWQLTKSINLTAEYTFQLKDSSLSADEEDFDFADQSFQQNVFTVGLQYAF